MSGKGRVAAVSIVLSDEERSELEGLSRRRKTAQGVSRRAGIVLFAAGRRRESCRGRVRAGAPHEDKGRSHIGSGLFRSGNERARSSTDSTRRFKLLFRRAS